MAYISHTQGILIQHGRNYGKKHIGQYKVDGYYELNREKVAIEFHGFFWHGCPKCFSRSTSNPVNDMSMGELYVRTMEKKQYVEQNGYRFQCIWECDCKRKLETDSHVKQYVDGLEFVSHLEPGTAFLVEERKPLSFTRKHLNTK